MLVKEAVVTFRVYFNRRKQLIDVILHDVHPNTFERRGGGRWGYYDEASGRNLKKGLFGEMHLVKSRVRSDTVAHELFHLLCDYIRSREVYLSNMNEEYYALKFDEFTRNFWREYKKLMD